MAGRIMASSILDPYVLLLLADGSLRLYHADSSAYKLLPSPTINVRTHLLKTCHSIFKP